MKASKLAIIISASIIVLSVLAGVILGFSADRKSETNVDISFISEGTGRLDVMTAEVLITEDLTIGNSNSPDYKSLSRQKGTVVYYVDLSSIEPYSALNSSGKTILFIPLPSVEAELYIDESTNEKLAEYQKGSYTGSAEEGFRLYMKSRTDGALSMRERISGYDELYSMAEDSAIRMVKGLVEDALIGEAIVEVFIRK